ncbi:MAG TPA: rhomboid family intramembrane serine protease [Vicinamibacterales bacterium]|jgi:membrane associated rhomboid family serine protease|nr:rhomboid family intramembrane serine protease [Vicinamibacterales bacterium]
MIPLRDVIPSRSTPYITVTIIALNAVAFLFELSLGERQLTEFLYFYGVIPAAFSWPTLITSMFLHGGWSHFIGNMWYLWIFGDNVEDRVGHGRFIVFYLLCGIAAAIGQIVMDPYSELPTIGASGAIAGVMGAYFVLYPHSRVLTLIPWIFIQIVEIPAIVLLGFWFLMQFLSAGAIAVTSNSHGGGGVAFAAHVAGFVVGAIGVFAFRKPEMDRWDPIDYY